MPLGALRRAERQRQRAGRRALQTVDEAGGVRQLILPAQGDMGANEGMLDRVELLAKRLDGPGLVVRDEQRELLAGADHSARVVLGAA